MECHEGFEPTWTLFHSFVFHNCKDDLCKFGVQKSNNPAPFVEKLLMYKSFGGGPISCGKTRFLDLLTD